MVAQYRQRAEVSGPPPSPRGPKPMLSGTLLTKWRSPAPSSLAGTDPRQQFVSLANEWRSATRHLSLASQKAVHPAYLRIIGMGVAAVPFILEDLRTRGGQWYLALRALTGQSPVPEDAAGNILKMKEAWLRWGRQQEHIS